MISRLISRTLFITLITSLVSCGSSSPKPERVVYFSSIALVSPQDVLDATQPKTRGDRAQEGAGRGLVAGTAGGAAVGAIACGPFLYGLCVVALASAGMLAGTATGVLYGFTGFPQDVARKLERRVEALSREHDLQSALVDHIRLQVDPEMLVEPETAEIQAVLTIENVEFVKEKGRVQLVSTVRATFESTESRRVPEHGSRVFKGDSEEFELNDWLNNDSGDLREAINQSLLNAADKVAAVLNARWKPRRRLRGESGPFSAW